MAFTLVRISDTHLSPNKAHFTANWAPLARWIVEQHPDLVIHTGDVTVDGADVQKDFEYAAELMHDLGVRFRAVPGNHDVGDPGHNHQPVNEERLERWRAYFGSDRWVEDAEGCRLIGFDALLLGSGEREEALQAEWLDAVMNDAEGRRIAWFLHRPLFLKSPDEDDTGYWSVKPQPRSWLIERLRRHSVILVASGHLHRAHDSLHDGIRYIWAPSSAFLVGPTMKAPPMPGKDRLGAVVYNIEAGLIEANIIGVPGLSPYWIDDVAEEVYPRGPANSQRCREVRCLGRRPADGGEVSSGRRTAG